MYDIIIIGAGVSGCACARELSRYDAKILVVEKEEDRSPFIICMHKKHRPL